MTAARRRRTSSTLSDRGEIVGGLRAQEREGVPVTLKDVLREEADATLTDAHGRGGDAIDICAVQEVTLAYPVQRYGREMCGRTALTDGLHG